MLFLQLPLFLVFLPGGDNEDAKDYVQENVCFQESISFKLIAISLFYNHSCTQNLGSSWLGEFQMQVWDSRFGTFVYLWPLSKGNFSNEELMELQKLFHLYFIRLAHVFHNHVIQWKLKYPFEIQEAGGCGLHHGEVRVAYRGSELLSFQNNSWLPSPKGGTRAQLISVLLDLNAVEWCWVGNDTLVPQCTGQHSSVGWIFLAVIVSLVLLTGLAFWHRKCWTHCDSPSAPIPLE
uniref:MHC class I-like antigen recognition-like domain-containing protein n=1 Tax=Sus scrofa TaxID=9823 RepID=A0A8D1S7M5_PIG